MPIYEFRCNACKRRFADLIRATEDLPAVACPACGGAKVTRLVSAFATTRSQEDTLNRLAEAPPDETDPRALSRWAKDFGREMEGDLGEDFSECMEEMVEKEFAGSRQESGIESPTLCHES